MTWSSGLSPSWESVIPKSRPNFYHQALSEVLAGPRRARAGSDFRPSLQLPCGESEAGEGLPF